MDCKARLPIRFLPTQYSLQVFQTLRLNHSRFFRSVSEYPLISFQSYSAMADRVLVHQINRPISEAYTHFADLHKFVAIHPVIYKCELLGESSYNLHDRMVLAGLGISFSYKVLLQQVTPHSQVVMFAEIVKGVTLKLVFDFTDNNGTTELTEQVIFNGPFFIKPLFLAFLIKQHKRMICNLNDANRVL